MLVLVSYDVASTTAEGRRRLRHVAKACQNYGQRVQKSVFECIVDPEQWTRLKMRLLDEYKTEEDSLRFYYLGSNWDNRVEHFGTPSPPDLRGLLIT